jgi:hypothetical protein
MAGSCCTEIHGEDMEIHSDKFKWYGGGATIGLFPLAWRLVTTCQLVKTALLSIFT